MLRLSTSAGAVLLSVVLSLGMSVGPAQADEAPPAEAPAVTAPATPEPEPESPLPEPEPVETPPTPVETPAPERTETPVPAETPAPTGSPTPERPATEPNEPPVRTAPAEETADLRLTVTFEKSSYAANEEFVVHADVINVGTATATNVRLTASGNSTSLFWSGFESGPPLAPGQTASGYARGFPRAPLVEGKVRITVEATSETADVNPADNVATAEAEVRVKLGNYAGFVYGDADSSRTMDPGEGLAGIKVGLFGGDLLGSYEMVTDNAGRFSFRGLPTGEYSHSLYSSDWAFVSPNVVVDEVDDPDVFIRGALRADKVLTVSAEFTEPAYSGGDTAHLALSVTNSAVAPMHEVGASCWVYGGKLISAGELGEPGGTTVPARTTRTFDVTFEIGDEGVRRGYMQISCQIGAPLGNGSVYVQAVARVPGAIAELVVCQLRRITAMPPLLGPPQSVPQPGVKVYLRSQVTGKVVVTAVSDEEGFFEFRDISADLYDFGVVGPFKGPDKFQVYADDDGSQTHIVYVTEGPEQPDPDAEKPREPQPPAPAPAPGPGPQPGAPAPPRTDVPEPVLAVTGANVGWLALGGLLSLVSGIALMTFTRRARSTG